jgi:hypothetical protein
LFCFPFLFAANVTAKVFSQPAGYLCRLVRHQLNGSVAAQSFGIGASLVRFVHDALSLGAIDSRELRMQLHRQAVAALVILDQAHQRPHRGIIDRVPSFLAALLKAPW